MHYLYRFINKEEQIIYIGRTNHLNARLMSQHFTAQGHLSPECYEECAKVEYAEVSNENEMRIYEIYYISKYKPKYNVIYSNEQRLSFELPELSWAHFKARNNDEPMTNRRKSYEIALEQMDKNMKKASDEVLTLIEAMEKLPDVYSFNENARRALQKIKESMEVLANAEDYKVDKRRKSLVKIK